MTLAIQPETHPMGEHVRKVEQQLLIVDLPMASFSREFDQNMMFLVHTVAERMLIQDVRQGFAARTTRSHDKEHFFSLDS